VQQQLKEQGIPTAVYYPQPLHLSAPLAQYGYRAGDFPVSERDSERTLAIPFYPEMTEEQLNRVADKVLLVAGAKQAVS
jgi:dTDP-4-amino-4,6-dideoxygalactose transaminase